MNDAKSTAEDKGSENVNVSERGKEKEKEKEKEFNWVEETAEFGFEDIDGKTSSRSWAKIISKKSVPVFTGILAVALCLLVFQSFLPDTITKFQGYSLKDILVTTAILSLLFLVVKLIVHCLFIVVKDNLSNNKILHNKEFKLEIAVMLWCFFLLPIGYNLRNYIPWIRRFSEKLFICVLLTDIAFIIKSICIEMFKIYFLSTSLKSKAKDIEIKEKIIESMQNYAYGGIEEESLNMFAPCFIVSFLKDSEDEDDPNTNLGMEFIQGDVGEVFGDMFTTSIFQKRKLSQRETMHLARDVFTKCSSDKDVVSFNDFCEIFSSPQEAVQAFLYFDTGDMKQITKKDMRDTLIGFHYDRENLNVTYNSLIKFVSVIDNLMSVVVLIPILFLYLVVFKMPIKQIITLSLSSALVLNFFVSGLLKDFYLNASFIITHPFDIGDEVTIDGKDYIIYRISLYHTEVLSMAGGKITFLNKVLCTRNIVNMSRAPQKLVHISFSLDPNITPAQFKNIKKDLLIYLRNREETFYESFTIQSESEANCHMEKLNCTLITRCKTLGSRMSKLQLKIELIDRFKEILAHNIRPPTPPPSPAESSSTPPPASN
ncbi:hypothetical protein NECID01_1373 [Nematocida sp. AWRm77]|nr:hypothetical protein NECID01_1373 [Nematocida sp. AWRm77]